MFMVDHNTYSTSLSSDNNIIDMIELCNRNSIMKDASVYDKIVTDFSTGNSYDELLHDMIFNGGNCSFHMLFLLQHSVQSGLYNRNLSTYVRTSGYNKLNDTGAIKTTKKHNIDQYKDIVNNYSLNATVDRIFAFVEYCKIINRKPVFIVPIVAGTRYNNKFNYDFTFNYKAIIMVLDSIGVSVSTHVNTKVPKFYNKLKFKNVNATNTDATIIISSNWAKSYITARQTHNKYFINKMKKEYTSYKDLLTPINKFAIMYFDVLDEFELSTNHKILMSSGITQSTMSRKILYGDQRNLLVKMGIISDLNELKSTKIVISGSHQVLVDKNVTKYKDVKRLFKNDNAFSIFQTDDILHSTLAHNMKNFNHKTITITNGKNNSNGQRECPD